MQKLKVFSALWSPYCKRLKTFLGEQRIACENVDIDEDEVGLRELEGLQNGGRTIPSVIYEDGTFAINPSPQDMAQRLALTTKARSDFYDAIVIGGGPASLTAASVLLPGGGGRAEA